MSTTLAETISKAVERVTAEVKAATADGTVTASEVFKLIQLAITELVAVAAALSDPGADKKAAVSAAVQKLYDDVIAPLDIPGVPNWIEPVVDRVIGVGLRQIVDGLIEAAVDRMKLPPSGIGATP